MSHNSPKQIDSFVAKHDNELDFAKDPMTDSSHDDTDSEINVDDNIQHDVDEPAPVEGTFSELTPEETVDLVRIMDPEEYGPLDIDPARVEAIFEKAANCDNFHYMYDEYDRISASELMAIIDIQEGSESTYQPDVLHRALEKISSGEVVNLDDDESDDMDECEDNNDPSPNPIAGNWFLPRWLPGNAGSTHNNTVQQPMHHIRSALPEATEPSHQEDPISEKEGKSYCSLM